MVRGTPGRPSDWQRDSRSQQKRHRWIFYPEDLERPPGFFYWSWPAATIASTSKAACFFTGKRE
jgi:hypothetical protein